MRPVVIYRPLGVALLLAFCCGRLNAQIGGRQSFQFLNVPINAKMAALGGYNVSVNAGDVNWISANPASLDSVAPQAVSLNYVNFYGGTSFSQLAYAMPLEKLSKLALGLTHAAHGEFDSYDESGNFLGTFNASEYALSMTVSHKMGPFVMALSPKLAVSSIAGFRASAVLFDLGGIYQHPEKQFSAGVVIKNAGFSLSRYDETKNKLPFDLRLGVSFKPEQMPVIFSFTGTNLPRRNLVYYEPGSRVNFNDNQPDAFDKVFSRINVGAEFLLGKNLHLLGGYNHRIRNEMKLEQRPGMAGFSLGVWMKIKAFELTIARSSYHVLGGNTHFTVSHNVKQLFYKRKESI